MAEKARISVQNLQLLHKKLSGMLQKIGERTAFHTNKKRSKGPDLQEGGIVYLLRKNIRTKRPSNKLDHTKLGPFKIRKKLGLVTFKLILPKGMRIHPVFHKSLLELAPENAPRPGPIKINPETQEPRYEVEKIVKHKLVNQKPHYLVHWKGYQPSEDTWEPEGHLTTETLRQYR